MSNADGTTPTRRRFLAAAGGVTVGAAIGIPVVMSVRACVPNVLYEDPRRFKVGPVDRFPEGATFIADRRVFVFRERNTFHCISAACTHLGCTVQLVRLAKGDPGTDFEFHCPCHGSKYRADGTNFAGPAPRPLTYFPVELAPDDGQLVIDMEREADAVTRLTV